MFDSGSASVKPYMRDILREIGIALSDVDNKISLDSHTDRSAYGNAARGYSNWELSQTGPMLRGARCRRRHAWRKSWRGWWSMASSLPLEPDNLSPSNRRISILVMTKEAEERLLGAAPCHWKHPRIPRHPGRPRRNRLLSQVCENSVILA